MHNWNDPATWSILLVDDEIDNLEVVAETLEFYGAAVKSASNGNSALDLLKSFSPTIVVTDLSMPSMDGWQLRGRIKGLPGMQNVPIIALSAHAMVGDKERALDAGFDGYLTKPINVPTLLEDMRLALKEKELGIVTPSDAVPIPKDPFEVIVPTLLQDIPISLAMPLEPGTAVMSSTVPVVSPLTALTPGPNGSTASADMQDAPPVLAGVPDLAVSPEPSSAPAAPPIPASDAIEPPKPAVNGGTQSLKINNEEKMNS